MLRTTPIYARSSLEKAYLGKNCSFFEKQASTLRNLLDVLDVANLLNITNGAFRRYHLSKMAESFECQAHIDDLTLTQRGTSDAGFGLKSVARMVRSSQRVVHPVSLIICTQGLIGRDDENVSSTSSERPQELTLAFGTLVYDPYPLTTVTYTDPDNIAFRPRSTSRKLPIESTCDAQETERRSCRQGAIDGQSQYTQKISSTPSGVSTLKPIDDLSKPLSATDLDGGRFCTYV
ncbi:hypothetical protein K443DRAFT_12262 [Laccaria amethystina LaAM-08-1]|uniref:Uncharacterized protein n=1 Tax=Laccaria amethystina LaAM-08-1 TaxID=1095629 RepID=A0A0C9WJ88_9AGAR|nr:hypothetical protein K443DRAFT_12262 [Laccaria amethystina LaAM-08-1]